MKKYLLLLFLFALCSPTQYIFAFGEQPAEKKQTKPGSFLELQKEIRVPSDSGGLFDVHWTGRKVTALILSAFVPGTGQTYLGNTPKGALITLVTFGCAVTVALSHNNFIAGNERLESLEVDYRNATNYKNADRIWNTMVNVKNDLDKDYNRRNLFLGITAGLWVLNIVDVIFLTEDQGEKPFGSLLFRDDGVQLSLNLMNQRMALSVQIAISY